MADLNIGSRDVPIMGVLPLAATVDGYPGHYCVCPLLLFLVSMAMRGTRHPLPQAPSCLLLTTRPVVAHRSGLLKKQSALHVFRTPARSLHHIYSLSLPRSPASGSAPFQSGIF
jgi:hypothetical protein